MFLHYSSDKNDDQVITIAQIDKQRDEQEILCLNMVDLLEFSMEMLNNFFSILFLQ